MAETWTSLIAALVAVTWVALILGVLIKIARARNRKLVRCPETGGIAIVDVSEVLPADPASRGPYLRVESCQLWPEKGNCGRGCLICSARPGGAMILA